MDKVEEHTFVSKAKILDFTPIAVINFSMHEKDHKKIIFSADFKREYILLQGEYYIIEHVAQMPEQNCLYTVIKSNELFVSHQRSINALKNMHLEIKSINNIQSIKRGGKMYCLYNENIEEIYVSSNEKDCKIVKNMIKEVQESEIKKIICEETTFVIKSKNKKYLRDVVTIKGDEEPPWLKRLADQRQIVKAYQMAYPWNW